VNHQLWKAVLNPSSPRYIEWRKIFESDEIPLISPVSFVAILGNERDTVHLINWHDVVGDESDRMVIYFAEKYKMSHAQVEKEFDNTGHVPIRASDVIISYSMRAFI
jgi:hypothetical protein